MTPFEHANSQAIDKARTKSNIAGAKVLNKTAGQIGTVAALITLYAPNLGSATVAAGALACSVGTDAYLVSQGEQDIKETLVNMVSDKLPIKKILPKKWADELIFGFHESNNLNTDMNSTSILDF